MKRWWRRFDELTPSERHDWLARMQTFAMALVVLTLLVVYLAVAFALLGDA